MRTKQKNEEDRGQRYDRAQTLIMKGVRETEKRDSRLMSRRGYTEGKPLFLLSKRQTTPQEEPTFVFYRFGNEHGKNDNKTKLQSLAWFRAQRFTVQASRKAARREAQQFGLHI